MSAGDDVDGPHDPIAAVTHPDPYPYYADLVGRRPLYRDDALGLWVASSAAVVSAVLTSDLSRVRPAAEPVPRALLGSPAGDVFGALVRMNDGAAHSSMKPAVSAATAFLEARIAEQASTSARRLAGELGWRGQPDPDAEPARVTDFAFRMPVDVLASLLGVPRALLAPTAGWVGDFVRCIAPGGTPEQLGRAKTAADRLIETFRSLPRGDTPSTVLDREAKRARRDDRDAVVANGIGFLTQAYEATAGLIGNTVVALARHRDARAAIAADPRVLTSIVREVVRHDPPVQNTRRFVARDGVVAGQAMKTGDAILIVLAAANRDPSVNPEPARFDARRTARRAFTFGAGAHACPGETVATTIAAAAVERLIASGVEPERLLDGLSYRASANTRVPLFAATRRTGTAT